MTDDEREYWEERAAMLQYLAGLTRQDAEAMATSLLEDKREREARKNEVEPMQHLFW